ncbi:radial spoke head 14 homolog isoform X2 [Phyllobates terribilis]|uniref:radial spoke head 14 homolog isoform X2 n=1 Tax=Phyllobates terribilis TaxID=111132 RepID=UPI003CCB2473
MVYTYVTWYSTPRTPRTAPGCLVTVVRFPVSGCGVQDIEDCTMAAARISPYLPPDIDPTKAAVAFGERALPKLKEELRDPALLTRQRALMAVCDLLHDPENVYQAVRLDFMESLKDLLYDEDCTVRQKTTEIFYIMAGHNIGRDGILRSDIIVAISHLLDDPVDICRRNVHQMYEMLSELPADGSIWNKYCNPDSRTAGAKWRSHDKASYKAPASEIIHFTLTGAAALVDAGLVSQLVRKLESELDEIQEVILETLHFCLQADASQALGAGAVMVLKEKLSHPLVSVRRKAACVLMEICVPLEGKGSVCKAEVIPLLVQLLDDSDAEVRANVAGALMYITITTQGKYAALHSGAIPKLLALVKDNDSKVRLNCLKALTTLSETPEGRKLLLQDVSLIQACTEDSSEAVSRAASIAVRVIQWKP